MSTIRRRRRSSRMNLGPYRRHELLGGVATYPVQGYDGYGDGHDTDMRKFISDEMRRDWIANRAALLEFWRSPACRMPKLFRTIRCHGFARTLLLAVCRGRVGIWTRHGGRTGDACARSVAGHCRPKGDRRMSALVRITD